MRKLMASNLSRLKKDTVFWLAVLCMIFCSIFFSCLNYRTNLKYNSGPVYVEDVLFNLFPVIAFACAGFISLYLGTEFDENTLRNKLIVGHTRLEIFCANYLTCMFASIALLFSILLFSGITGYICFKVFMMGWLELAFLILCCILSTMVFSAICVAFGMNIHKKAISVVVTTIFLFGILLLASYMEGALQAPEMVYDSITISMDGIQYGDLIPNSAYVEGTTRKIMEFIYDMLPTGQAIQLNTMDVERCARWPWLSLIILVISTLFGYLPFRKRDIR